MGSCHTKDHHKNVTNCHPGCHAGFWVGTWHCNSTVYEEMHYKGLLGSITRAGYLILVPNFYLVLHAFRCQKSTLWIIQSGTTHSYMYIPAREVITPIIKRMMDILMVFEVSAWCTHVELLSSFSSTSRFDMYSSS